jgi:hypothetical protein
VRELDERLGFGALIERQLTGVARTHSVVPRRLAAAVGLATLNRELIAHAEALDVPRRVVLDVDSTEIRVYGQQEQSAYKEHFASTCYHPLLLFNREGGCLAAKLRPGNVHSAAGWEELLLPEIECQQPLGKEVVFHADVVFAKPELYEALERAGGEVPSSGERPSATED